jgi:hypothetical protein
MWDFVVDKVALGQVFSEYFGFPCQSSFHQLLQKSSSPIIWGLYNRSKRPQYQGLSPTPPIIIKNSKLFCGVLAELNDVMVCKILRSEESGKKGKAIPVTGREGP